MDDVLNRTETALPQAQAFLASELAVRATGGAREVIKCRTSMWPKGYRLSCNIPKKQHHSNRLTMHLKHHNTHHFLAYFTRDELLALSNALNEVCHGIHLDEAEFETRIGAPRTQLATILGELGHWLDAPPSDCEVMQAWADGCSVQVRCISASGDPADMSSGEARAFAAKVIAAADEADAAG